MKISIILIFFAFFSFTTKSAPFRIAAYNIENYDSDKKATNKNELIKILFEVVPDIMSVEEIVNKESFYSLIKSQLPFYSVQVSKCGGRGNQSLGFIWNPKRFKLISFIEDLRLSMGSHDETPTCDMSSRPVAIGIFRDLIKNTDIVFMSLHLKAQGTPEAHEKRIFQLGMADIIKNELRKQGYNNFVMMGDFNTTEFTTSQGKASYLSIFKKMNMLDLGDGIQCTNYWHGGTENGLYEPSILDHIIMSSDMVFSYNYIKSNTHAHCAKTKCHASRTSGELGKSFSGVSDHCPISADFN